ncbi:hypothetical protein M408DRAFT_329163 [Serendipita vermifera MAFF 305830]|uniref:Methyltransferase domain-containing protein n=1 Tax=Serendipita vermifera MAFF 305830 TaxID=933852 RepID=A0A0C3BB80_SERVB|nr:hypothetical protein M408DRAFT_329163 [Serendipita vermifera MAFF 305830]
MPRTDNFQGLPTPFFPADTYYFASNTNLASTKPKSTKSKPRSSLSSDPTSKATPNDDIINSLYSHTPALARANSSATNLPRRPTKKRPSTGNPSSSNVGDLESVPTAEQLPLPAIPVTDDKTKQTTNPVSEPTTTMNRNKYKLKNGKKHHPHPSQKAPYPRSYETTAIDHDTSNHIFFTQLSKSVTWHEFSTPPAKVLDLGCGNGVWILDAAKSWPHSHFVGLDLMPIQPNLNLVAPELQQRIQWCISNFLDRLPFDDNHFDFIHIRRIARGVPENKWPYLLEEVSRVLKPDGALEVVEEDLIFPGGQEPCTCHYPPDIVPPDDFDDLTPHPNVSSSSHDHHDHEHHQQLQHPEGSPPDTPVPTAHASPKSSTVHPFYYSSPSVNARDHTKLEEAYNDMHSSKFINLTPISVLTETLAHYFKDVRSHPPVLVTFPPPEEDMWNDGSGGGTSNSDTAGAGSGHGSAASTAGRTRVRRRTKSRPSTAESSIGSSGGSPTQSSQVLSPTSTHETGNLFALGPDADENAAAAASAAGYMSHPPVGGWHTLHLDVRSLVHPRQPFIMIDRCRMPARGYGYGLPTTSTGVASSSGDESTSRGHPMTRLPNTTFELDLQNLTLLLSQSVTDVLECSEAIWEYLVEQGKARTKKPPARNTHAHSLSYAPPGSNSSTTMQSGASQGIIDREEFDHWISKYAKEMHARIGMAEALRRRFGWETKGLTSEYVSSRSLAPLPTFFSPTSATGRGAQRRPLDRNDPSSDDVHNATAASTTAVGTSAGHASSSSLLAAAGGSIGGEESSSSGPEPGKMRQRTGSAPERVSSSEQRKAGKHAHGRGVGAGHSLSGHSHGRAHSLDAANAWEALTAAHHSHHPGGGEDGEGGSGQGDGHGESGLEVELPRLSRCIRVFVAWNSKA